jgi:hypothetical protein
MVDADTVRRLALALPEAIDESEGERLAVSVAGKGFVWSYYQRMAPKKPRVLRPDVVAIRCELPRKELLIEAAPDTFFDDDHYRGFPAVLARLAAIEAPELAALLAAAWRLQAPRSVLARHPGQT